MDHVLNYNKIGLKHPFEQNYPQYVLIEVACSSNSGECEERLLDFLEKAMEQDIVLDGIVYHDE